MARIHDFSMVLAKVRKSFHETTGMVDLPNSDKGVKKMVICDIFEKSQGKEKFRRPEGFQDLKKEKLHHRQHDGLFFCCS